MEPMKLPSGYLLPEGKTMQDVLNMDAALLASEGLELKRLLVDERAEDEDDA